MKKFQAFADLLETGLCLVSSHAKLFFDYTGMQTPGQHKWQLKIVSDLVLGIWGREGALQGGANNTLG